MFFASGSGSWRRRQTAAFIAAEQLESRRLLAFALNVNFQPAGVVVPAGYSADSGLAYANRGNGFTYGWNAANATTRDRNATPDQRYDTLIHTYSRTWELAVPNGTYNVKLIAGDPSYYDSKFAFNAEGVLALSGTPTSSSRFITATKTVTVSDGKLTITNATGASNNKLAFLEITDAAPSPAPPPPAPSVPNIPTTIQAENFDSGGKNISYYDTTLGNAGKLYRSTDVDIAASSEGGYTIGYTSPGEWLKYTFNAAASGTFNLDFRVASGSAGGVFHVEIDGVDKTGPINVANTGGWQQWKTLTKSGVSIGAGQHVMRLVFDKSNSSGYIANINWIKFSSAATTPTTPTTPGDWVDAWATAAPIPRVRQEARGAVMNGKLWVFGGFYSNATLATGQVDIYDIATNTWSKLPTYGQMPHTHSTIATHPATNSIYFIGGLFGNYPGTPTDRVFKFDTVTRTWSEPLPRLPVMYHSGGAAIIGGNLHFFGGSEADRVTDTGRHLVLNLADPVAGWQSAPEMPDPRCHFSTAVLDGKIYVMGGQHNHENHVGQSAAVHRYDPVTKQWQQLANLPTPKSHAEMSTFVFNGKIIMAGGQIGRFGSTDEVVSYEPATSKWTTIGKLPVPLQSGFAMLHGNQVIVTIGNRGDGSPRADTWIGELE